MEEPQEVAFFKEEILSEIKKHRFPVDMAKENKFEPNEKSHFDQNESTKINPKPFSREDFSPSRSFETQLDFQESPLDLNQQSEPVDSGLTSFFYPSLVSHYVSLVLNEEAVSSMERGLITENKSDAKIFRESDEVDEGFSHQASVDFSDAESDNDDVIEKASYDFLHIDEKEESKPVPSNNPQDAICAESDLSPEIKIQFPDFEQIIVTEQSNSKEPSLPNDHKPSIQTQDEEKPQEQIEEQPQQDDQKQENDQPQTLELRKWPSQQKLVIVVDDRPMHRDPSDMSACITTDADSNTIIAITTAATTTATTTNSVNVWNSSAMPISSTIVSQPLFGRGSISASSGYGGSCDSVEVVVSASGENSRFVSCVDIPEATGMNEISEESGIVCLNPEENLEVEASILSEHETFQGPPPEPESKGVIQYIFGCMPCYAGKK